MKTLDEAANEYADKEFPNANDIDAPFTTTGDLYEIARESFVLGANWQASQGWVSVKDRLPGIEANGRSIDVLVCRPNKYSENIDVLIGTLHAAKPEGQEYGRGNGMGGYPKTYDKYWSFPGIALLKDVTYWQPLPQPPKQD